MWLEQGEARAGEQVSDASLDLFLTLWALGSHWWVSSRDAI